MTHGMNAHNYTTHTQKEYFKWSKASIAHHQEGYWKKSTDGLDNAPMREGPSTF